MTEPIAASPAQLCELQSLGDPPLYPAYFSVARRSLFAGIISSVRQVQTCGAVILAVPLIGSSVNHAFQLVAPPMDDGSQGARMWEIIRDGGLMDWLAVGHMVLGVLLLIPRTRFAAGLAQLPITIGIVAFNVTMFPSGVVLALLMLAVNLAVVLRRADLQRLIAHSSG